MRRIEGAPGSGSTPILLLHGFTGSGEGWGEEIPRRLARRGPVWIVDLPGHGDAAHEVPPFHQVVDDLAHEVGDVQAHWIGYSMGGRIALSVAVRYPEVVASLVLESASPGLEDPAARRERRASDEALARSIESEGIEAFVDFWEAHPLFRSRRRLPQGIVEGERARRLGQDPAGLAGALRQMGTGVQPSHWGDLEGLDRRVLLLTGALDEKFVAIADRMAATLPRAWRRTLSGVGHTVHLEAPDSWLTAVESFLDGG